MNALLVICGIGFISLLGEIANFKKWLTGIVIVGLAAAVALALLDWNQLVTTRFSNMVDFNNFALAFTALICTVTIAWFWMARDYFQGDHRSDRLALVTFALAGGVIMIAFNNMAMLFLGIEILSVSLYVLAGSNKGSLLSNEAAFKYFLMGSFATGFLLMGIALVYGATGSFDIAAIHSKLAGHPDMPGFFTAGVLLILVGMAFKISAVPFHFWAPDVYEGSPTVITAFMSTVVKTAAIAAFYKVFSLCFGPVQGTYLLVMQVIIVLTLAVANVTAVYQSSAKRILAYSSVGHVGYILMALMASPDGNAGGILFYYMAAYSTASIAAFYVLHAVETGFGNTHVDSFNGLYKRNPFLAVTMTIALLSLAGIPPLAGFFGKYLVFARALEHGYVLLVILGVVTSLIGVFYYFRIIVAMYWREVEGTSEPASYPSAILVLLVAIMLGLGFFPDAAITLLSGY